MTTVQTLRTRPQPAPVLAARACEYDGASGSLQFDWRGVAASAVGAGVGQAVSGAIGNSFGGDAFGQFAKRAVSGLAAGTAAAVMRGGKIAIQQVATDAFGNVLGQSIAEANWGGTPALQAATTSGGRDVGRYDDLGQRQLIEEATGRPIVTDMDDNFAALGPIGSEDVLAANRLKVTPVGHGAGNPDGIARSRAAADAKARIAELERNIAELGTLGTPASVETGGGLRMSSELGFKLQTTAEGLIPSDNVMDNFARGFANSGSDWSVLEGEKPLSYSVGSATRSGLGLVYDGLTGAGDFRAAGQAFDRGNYVEGTMYGLRGVGSAGMTAMTLGDYALAKAAITGTTGTSGLRIVGGTELEAGSAVTEMGAASGINPRLTQRLEAWRAYQARGGQYDMQRWVQSTQGQSWGTGFSSGYGKWINSVESVHGNSLLSTRPTTLYQLYTDEGQFLKWGISQNMSTRYSGSFMADKQIFRYADGPRANMLRLEREMVETRPGPLNFEPWAGKRKP
jgi:hypothetical protein